MNYVYDILLNFNKNLYESFEWNKKDEINHIRKIPIFKINTKDLVHISSSEFKIKNDLLENIKNKKEIFFKNNIKIINYCCLLSDGNKTISFKFNKEGRCIARSSLFFDEELEANEIAFNLKNTIIEIDMIRKQNKNEFKTRQELEMEKFMKEKIREEKNIDKLKYLYFDCFGKVEENKNKIIDDLKKEIDCNWNEVHTKIYNFFKLVSH